MPHSLRQLQSTCTTLQATFQHMHPATVEERLWQSYGEKTLNQIAAIFTQHPNDTESVARSVFANRSAQGFSP